MINDKKLTIAFVIPNLCKGGAERVVCNLANYLIKSNNVYIINTLETKDEYIIDNRIKRIFIKRYTGNIIRRNYMFLREMLHVYRSINADIFICFCPYLAFQTLLLKTLIKSKVIVSERNDPKQMYRRLKEKVYMKITYRLADGFVFQTLEAQKYFSKKIQKKSKIILNSVNQNFLILPYNGVRNKNIVSVGRLMKQKNQIMLIKAFEKINYQIPDYKLIIYGEGELRVELEKYIKDHNLNKKVILPGIVDNIVDVIYDSSLFVLTSDYEGLPNALIEAMSIGLPCISTDCPCGGPKYLINNYINGILIETGNIEMLSKEMLRILKNSKLQSKLSKNANKIQKIIAPQKINKEWEDYIKRIVQN